VFDAPQVDGPFEARLCQLHMFVQSDTAPFAEVLRQTICRDRRHLAAELAQIEQQGGEGLMLRQPGSLYVPSRSATLLKVKTFRDCEATVIGHQPGAGRHRGRLGALLVRLASGVECAVGTGFTDAERERPPAIGTVITLKYQELTDAGVPRFPVFVRVRGDSPAPISSPSKGTLLMPPKTATPTRRFEFVEGTSSKFWEVSCEGSDVIVRYGRIGSAGQTLRKPFPDAAAAERHAEKLIGEKTGKGYAEVSG
jgi:DNA ligase-1